MTIWLGSHRECAHSWGRRDPNLEAAICDLIPSSRPSLTTCAGRHRREHFLRTDRDLLRQNDRRRFPQLGLEYLLRATQLGYVEEATNIIHEMSGGKHPKNRIWVNVLHAVDGAWGVNGAALTNDEIKVAAAKG